VVRVSWPRHPGLSKKKNLSPTPFVDDLPCYLRYPKVHSITALNISYHFVFQGISPSIKTSHLVMRIPTVLWGTNMEKVKRLLFTTDIISNLCVLNTQIFRELLMNQHVLFLPRSSFKGTRGRVIT